MSSSLKGRRMQINALRTKQVSHVGSRDDHGQPIAGGDDQKCRRRVGSGSTGIQEPSCADIWTPGRRLWTDLTRSTTSSQCSWLRRKWVSPRSNLRVFETIRAAEDTLQLVGRLLRSANQKTVAVIDSACDKRMNEGSICQEYYKHRFKLFKL